MKTKITKLFSIVTIITLLLVATGCSDMNSASKTKNTGSGYTLTGSITVKGDTARTATSSFSFIKAKQYSVTATYDDFTVNGTISNSDEGVTYTLNLPVKGTWTITATLTVNNKVYGTGQTTVAIPLDPPDTSFTTNDIQIQLITDMDPTKQGAIKLPIYNNSSKNLTITWKWITTAKNGNTPLNDLTLNVAKDENGTFTVGTINCGSYEVQLLFKDSTGKLVYSCYETINVFADFTTDLWYGDSPYIDSSNKFAYTDEVAKTFAEREEISEDSPLYVLWSSVQEEEDSINMVQPIQNQVGGQVFASIRDCMSTTSAIPAVGPNYCFAGTTLYAPPYRYTSSYAGYIKDSSFDLTALLYEKMNNNPYYIKFGNDYDCFYLDGYLYFSFDDDDYDYYIGRYDTVNGTLAIVNTSFPVVSIAVTHKKNDSDKDVLYYVTLQESYDPKSQTTTTNCTLHRKPFFINENTISFYDSANLSSTDIQPASININYLWTINYAILKISDLQIVDNYLYVLAYTEGIPVIKGNKYSTAIYQYYDVAGNVVCDSFISNGGILKFDITSTSEYSFLPSSWTDSTTPGIADYFSGLHLLSNSTTYYNDASGTDEARVNGEFIGIDMENNQYTYEAFIAVQPPLVSSTANSSYLYGPRKILGINPTNNQLIIVDDGGYVQFNDGEPKPMPVNRIVAVDLTDGSIDYTVDVGATFSSSFNTSAGYFKAVY